MVGWRAYLPDSPDTLARIETWLYVIAAIGGALAILLPFVARDIARHRVSVVLNRELGDRDAKYRALQEKTDVLEEERRPRTINDEQLGKLQLFLQTHPVQPTAISIQVTSGDGEAARYANQLRNLLRYLQWDVGDNTLVAFGSQHGVIIAAKADAPEDVRDSARGLADALNRSGIAVEFQITDKAAAALVLSVGIKPRKY